MIIRTIKQSDNFSIAFIIRSCLEEFNANKPGTAYFDQETDHLSDVFTVPKSTYFVLENDDKIYGGCGIYPTKGLNEDTCELVKLYLMPEVRGKGYSKILIKKCMEFAVYQGFKYVYLETMPELKKATTLYEKLGWNYLCSPLGNTGHSGCGLWMLKKL
jgi:putative acetyltransferase